MAALVERLHDAWVLFDAYGVYLGQVHARGVNARGVELWKQLPGWKRDRLNELFVYDEEG